MGILQLIATSNFITLNKDLIKTLGLEEALLIGELASEYDYWQNQDKLEDGFFYSTVENVKEHTTLTDYQQRKALNKLQKLGLIETKVMGIPAKRYIKINEKELVTLLNQQFLKNLRTGSQKTEELDVKKLKGNNNIINNNIDNNIININAKSKKFVKPTLEEIEAYIKEKDLKVNGRDFFEYFEEGNWIDSKGNKVKNWKQKLLTWNKYKSGGYVRADKQEHVDLGYTNLESLYDN